MQIEYTNVILQQHVYCLTNGIHFTQGSKVGISTEKCCYNQVESKGGSSPWKSALAIKFLPQNKCLLFKVFITFQW